MTGPERPGLGVELHQVLAELDVTAAEVAQAVGMTAGTVKAIAAGKSTTGPTVRAMCDGLAVLVDVDTWAIYCRLVAAATVEDWATYRSPGGQQPGPRRPRWAEQADPGGAQSARASRRGMVEVEAVP